MPVLGCHHAKNPLGAFIRRSQADAGAPAGETCLPLAERGNEDDGDGQHLATGNGNGTVYILRLPVELAGK